MRSLMKWCGRILLAVVFGTGTAAAILWYGSIPSLEGERTLPGLSAPVAIDTAETGIATIRATNLTDAYRALGYLHARDRLFQMEMTRRIGTGRLSELIGDRGLGIDRYMRALGVGKRALADEAALPKEAHAEFQAYADGVNHWLETRESYLPLPFQLIWHEPEPWRIADSLIWGKLMAFQLSGDYRSERLRAELLSRLSPERLHQLLPPHDAPGPATLAPQAEAAAKAMIPVPSPLKKREASNAWVIRGGLTDTGAPILANDPHLGLELPGTWYPIRIETPNLTLTGVGAAGVPMLVLGHNGHIAWGMTTTYADTMDLVAIEEDPTDPDRYLTARGAQHFTIREEVISRSGGEPETITVRETVFGPILPSRDPGSPLMALQWTGFDSSDQTPLALRALNRAQDWDDFLRALQSFGAPIQNLFYADRDGNVGVAVPGLLPIRAPGHSGGLPLISTDPKAAWRGILRRSPTHALLNPEAGRIYNANNRVVPPDRPPAVAQRFQPPERALRLRDALFPTPPRDIAGQTDLQTDTLSYAAKRLVPVFLAGLEESAEKTQARQIFTDWDFRMNPDSAAPALYAAWHNAVFNALVRDDIGDQATGGIPIDPSFLENALTGEGEWCDNKGTDRRESCAEILGSSLRSALDLLTERLGDDPQDWRWSKLHRAPMRHRIMGAIPLLGDLTARPVTTPGGDHTLNRGQMSGLGSDDPFAHVHGAGLRAVYDLSNLDNSVFAIAGGISGNPASPFYGNLVDDWADGRYFRIPGRGEDRKKSVAHLSLLPSP